MKLSSLKGLVDVVEHVGDDLSPIRAARISYGRGTNEVFDRDKDGRLLRYLLRNGHWSPFEHPSITFRVTAPIFVARQWFRHRSWSFNEISARYTEVKDSFYVPEVWRGQSSTNKQASEGVLDSAGQEAADFHYRTAIRAAQYAYKQLLDLGVSREMARMALPVSSFTEFYGTANLRSILHFLEQRLSPHAQQEIRSYAEGVHSLTKQLFPETIAAWREVGAVQVPTVLDGLDAGSPAAPSTNTQEFWADAGERS